MERHHLTKELLDWYAEKARDLPWRRFFSPYAVLVSEFMLQQTQVTTVIPFFMRWMERFPTFEALAEADEEEALRLWEGLGYYRRARSLLAVARTVAADFGGLLPDDEKSLLALPGIGPYTAGAILSLAFNRPAAALDGNVERVLTRLFDIGESPKLPAVRRRLRNEAERLIPPGKARDFNQALMELGTLICLPRNPSCLRCPWNEVCLARRRKTTSERPLKSPKAPQEKIDARTLLVIKKNRLLILRHDEGERWEGLWEFPTFEKDGAAAFAASLGLGEASWKKVGKVSHAFTRYKREITVYAFILDARRERPLPEGPFLGRETLWVAPADLDRYPFSAGSRKIREKLIPGLQLS